ncbi:hypothetical protein C0J27_02990 [Candidatus Chromulinivorax destructor]|uniref:Uncharacterized protein n=2 Tax=Candidatus Chromulinivorax destructor TaxID=2066483 RepID=A0A345ZBM9_9BACT|nr:hypothetical protein C0J27_02990 [Candidatus Chromulinivorax destructor]
MILVCFFSLQATEKFNKNITKNKNVCNQINKSIPDKTFIAPIEQTNSTNSPKKTPYIAPRGSRVADRVVALKRSKEKEKSNPTAKHSSGTWFELAPGQQSDTSKDDRDSDDHDEDRQSPPVTSLQAGVDYSAMAAAACIYGLATSGLVLSAPLALGAGFFIVGASFFIQDTQEKAQIDRTKQTKQSVIEPEELTKNLVYRKQCEEIKAFFTAHALYEKENRHFLYKNKKSYQLTDIEKAQKEKKIQAYIFFSQVIAKLLEPGASKEKEKIFDELVQALIAFINIDTRDKERVIARHSDKNNIENTYQAQHEKYLEDIFSFLENLNCDSYAINEYSEQKRIMATSVVLAEAYILESLLGTFAGPIGVGILAGSFMYQNREFIFDYIQQARNYKKLTPEERSVLDQLEKYSRDLAYSLEKAINIGSLGAVKQDDILDARLIPIEYDGRQCQLLVVLENNGSQRLYLIPRNSHDVHEIPPMYGMENYLYSAPDVKAKVADYVKNNQPAIQAAAAKKQAEVDKVLSTIEKNLPTPEIYDLLPDHSAYFPVSSSAETFQAALSKDGKPLRGNDGCYYDVKGYSWTLDKENNRWVITNYSRNHTIITNATKPVSSKDTPSCNQIDNNSGNQSTTNSTSESSSDSTPMDSTPQTPSPNSGCGGVTDELQTPTTLTTPTTPQQGPTDTAHGPTDEPESKSTGCGQSDPAAPDLDKDSPGCGSHGNQDPDDFILQANRNKEQNNNNSKAPHGTYRPSPKHHPNSPDHIGKPPRDGQDALDNSFSVEKSTQRVAVQDGKVVILKYEEEDIYHGYIVEDITTLPQKVKDALVEQGFMKDSTSKKLTKQED